MEKRQNFPTYLHVDFGHTYIHTYKNVHIYIHAYTNVHFQHLATGTERGSDKLQLKSVYLLSELSKSPVLFFGICKRTLKISIKVLWCLIKILQHLLCNSTYYSWQMAVGKYHISDFLKLGVCFLTIFMICQVPRNFRLTKFQLRNQSLFLRNDTLKKWSLIGVTGLLWESRDISPKP